MNRFARKIVAIVVALFTAQSANCQITADAATVAAQMYPGWNLGNTLEAGNNAHNFKNSGGLAAETGWQGTKTTKAIIDFVKAQGFRSVRVPTAWVMGHISDATTVTIDAAWMARVKEIVDYCVSDGLYVVLNDHWDGGWVENSFSDLTPSTVDKNCQRMKAIWTQIANTFKDYDEHLLFAGLNEPNCDNQAMTDVLVKYEQAFIDAVRATGGNNLRRSLVVQGPSTDIDKTNKYYNTLPTDIGGQKGYLMVEVHYYTPWNFCGMEKDESWGKMSWFWGSGNHVSGSSYNSTWGEEAELKKLFNQMKTKFVDKGYPVIMGEYGCQWRKLTAHQAEHDASVKLFHKVVNREAVNCGIVPFVWDINHANQQGTKGVMTVINRSTLSIFCTPAMEGIREGAAAATWGGPTSGIVTVPFDFPAYRQDAPAYTLSGRRLSGPAKGIAIVSGRKVLK